MSRPSDPFAPRALSFAGTDGLTLRADARGEPGAPPVLFLHGGGQTRHAWGGTAAALARDGRLSITLDLRGHGESTKPKKQSNRVMRVREGRRSASRCH